MASNEEAKPTPLQLSSAFLLTNKEKLTETFIQDFLNGFEAEYGTFDNLPADISLQQQLALAEEKLCQCSILINHKITPMIRDYIKVQFQKHLSSKHVEIKMKEENVYDLAEKYRKCFNAFFYDTHSVHFSVLNRTAIGDLELIHYFYLMFYSMSTAKRKSGDRCLCLLLVGRSSTGKSLLCESVFQQLGHNYVNDKGVGRWETNGKNVLLMYDIQVSSLFQSQDITKLKAICRTEPASVKKHSKTTTIEPIHVFGTSNQNLFSHTFLTYERGNVNLKKNYPSCVEPTKKILKCDIQAFQFRFLEAFVRQPPVLPYTNLDSFHFKVDHLKIGLFSDMVDILLMYSKENFGSQYLYVYAITSLCFNITLLTPTQKADLKPKVLFLIDHYDLDPDQVKDCLSYMD